MFPDMRSGRSPLHEQGLQEGRRPDGTAVYVPLTEREVRDRIDDEYDEREQRLTQEG